MIHNWKSQNLTRRWARGPANSYDADGDDEDGDDDDDDDDGDDDGDYDADDFFQYKGTQFK